MNLNKRKVKDLFKFLPKAKHKAGEGLEKGTYPFYTSSAVVNKYFDEYDYEPNKLIFATGGSASVHYADSKFAVSTDNFILEPNEDVNAKYVYYYLKNNLQIIQDGFHGAGLQHLSKDYLNEVSVPMLDNASQDKVVSILDKADEIRAKKKLANDKLDEFLKSTFISMFGDPVRNEKNYRIEKLQNATKFLTDGKHGDCEDEDNSGYYFVSAKCINNGKIDLTQARQIKYDDYKEVNKRVKINVGDLLIVNTGATIGKMAIIRDEGLSNSITLQKSVAVINVDNDVLNSEYLSHCLLFKSMAKVSAGSAIHNLLLSTMRAYELPIPPIEDQNKFAKIVEKVEAQKQKNELVIEQMNNLFNSLSQRAFKGEL